MAKFTSTAELNIWWRGIWQFVGAAGTEFSLPDSLQDEFDSEFSGVIPGLTWTEVTSNVSLPVAQSDVTDLVSDLAGKAASVHTHAESSVTNLTSDLAGKYDKTGGTISGSVTATGTMAATKIGGTIYADQYSSLSAAIAALSSTGGRVHIPAGTYTLAASLEVTSPNTIIEGVGPQSVIDGTGLGASTHALFTSQSGVTFRNFKVVHGTQNDAIRIQGDDCAVEGVTVVGGLNGINTQGARTFISGNHISASISSSGGFAVLLSPSADGGVVMGNRVVAGRIGIGATESTRYVTISGNFVSGTTEIGIDLDGDTGTLVGGYNTVIGNTIVASGSSAYGCIFIGESHDNVVTGNTLKGSTGGAGVRTVTSATRNTISGNVIVGNALNGILLSDADDSLVVGNEIYNNGQHGIDVFVTDNPVIVGNRLKGNGTSGSTFDGIRFNTGGSQSGAVVAENLISGHPRYGINIVSSDVSSVYIGKNIYQSNTSGELSDSGTLSRLDDLLYTTERWAIPTNISTSAAASAVANRGYYAAINVPFRVRASKIRFQIGAQSGSCQVGIYSRNFVKLAASATSACPATGVQSIALSSSIDLSPGLYYLAIMFDNSSATFHMSQNNSGSYLFPVFKDEASFGLPAGPVSSFSAVGSVCPLLSLSNI